MIISSNSPPSPIQSENSPGSRQSRRSLDAGRGTPSLSDRALPFPLVFGTADQDQIGDSSSRAPPGYLLSDETPVAMKSSGSIAYPDAQSKSTEDSGAENKPVWSKPSENGVAVVGAVMGAESWPELSKSTRGGSSKPSDSTKGVPHGVFPVSQGTLVGSSSPPKEDTPIVSTPNHVGPLRQRYVKPGGGSSSHDGNSSQAPNATASSPSNPFKSGGHVGGSNGGNDQRRGNFRRTNGGPQQGYHRNFGGRESHTPPQQRPGPGPFIRGPPPPSNAPYVPTPSPHVQMVTYVNHMGYMEVRPVIYYMPGPYQDMPMTMAPQMFFPVDVELNAKILQQIDFYFSTDNLARDTFLRQKMDDEGWVPIKLLAGFAKVAELTNNIQLIYHVLQASDIIEMQGDKIRRKDDWKRWILRLNGNTTT